MDPNACLMRFLLACQAEDRDEAVDALEDLGDWLHGGGFLPDVEQDDNNPRVFDVS